MSKRDQLNAALYRLKQQASEFDRADLDEIEAELRSRVTKTANRIGLGGMLVAGILVGAIGGDLINRFNAWLG